jgi:uncharacterized protein YjiS (DUF1127 family)
MRQELACRVAAYFLPRREKSLNRNEDRSDQGTSTLSRITTMLLISMFQAVQSAFRILKIERQLSRLDDRMLADIGLTRSDILKTAIKMAE